MFDFGMGELVVIFVMEDKKQREFRADLLVKQHPDKNLTTSKYFIISAKAGWNLYITPHHLEKKYYKNDSLSMASIERKKHIRADIQEEIQCVNPVTPEENSTGVVRDISYSAMCLYVLSPVRIGQEITLKVHIDITRKALLSGVVTRERNLIFIKLE